MFDGIIDNATKKKILETVRSKKVREGLLNIVGEVDGILDEVATESGSKEIREELAILLEEAAKVLRKDE